MVSPRGSFITSPGPTAAERLAVGDQVRDDALDLEGMELAGAARPDLDLVADQEDAVASANLRQPLEETGRRHDVAGIAHQRLEKYPADLRRRRDGREQILEVVEHLLDDVARKGRPVGVGVGQVNLPRMGARDGVKLERVVAGDG
jgi:hypothetical protein